MKLGVVALSWALVLGVLTGSGAAHASPVEASDVQTLPRHLQENAYSHALIGASPEYVMHNVHDLPWADGRGHLTVVRTGDGSAAWSDFDAHADAANVDLVGRYVTEKIGESTNWPDSVRFRDVETHQVAGEIALPDGETLRAVGPGWLLSTRESGAPGVLSSVLVIHRLDGTTDVLDDVPLNWSAQYVGYEGDTAWVHDSYSGPLFQVDIATGETTVVRRPDGMDWTRVLIGPTRIFNLEDQYSGHIRVTAVDRTTGDSTTYELSINLGGNTPKFLTRGNGLAAYEPGQAGGATLFEIDLPGGTVSTPIQDHVSQGRQMSPGTLALVVDATAPGTIMVDRGDGPSTLVDFPRVSEGAGNVAYDGSVWSFWGDGTVWTIDPDRPDDGWTKTPWNSTRHRVTVSGSTTLVNDFDENDGWTNHWHLSWPGGQRDVEGDGLVLGHGGELLVRRAVTGADAYQVERVRTGEVVATADSTGVVADGSMVWRTLTPGVLTGVDVDRPDAPAVSVPVNIQGRNATLMDVRGRWALVSASRLTVVDTRSVVAPFSPPASSGSPAPPQLGNGFVVTTVWTYDSSNHVNGHRTIISDLSAEHASRDLVDPVSGEGPTTYAVDEAGSHSLAYVDRGGLPKVLRLPWLQDAPLPAPDDTAPPTAPDDVAPSLGATTAPDYLVRSTTDIARTFTWNWSDAGTDASPASGIASYEVRHRTRTDQGPYGTWTTTELPTDAAPTLTQVVHPGTELCAQSRATDAAGNQAPWSPERCVRVDGSAPVLNPATGSPRFMTVGSLDQVRYVYDASDDNAVGSYDVQARTAAPGANLGAWTNLRSATTGTSVDKTVVPGSEHCFRFRATDRAGNTSPWSPARCTSIAFQDKTFASPGGSRRVQSRRATDGWYRRLDHTGAWMRLPRPQVGKTIALWVLTGPGQGIADVYVGGTRAGSVKLSAKSTGLRVVTVRMPHNGRVKIVERNRRPVGIDAIAIER